MEAAIRSELIALLAYANKSEVARALGVTPQAVINWSRGRNTSAARLEQVRELFGVRKEAAPSEEGAASELLRLWTGPEPPPWAVGLTRQLMELIQADRETTVEQMIQSALDRAEAEVLLRRPRGSGARRSSGRAPSNTAGLGGRRP